MFIHRTTTKSIRRVPWSRWPGRTILIVWIRLGMKLERPLQKETWQWHLTSSFVVRWGFCIFLLHMLNNQQQRILSRFTDIPLKLWPIGWIGKSWTKDLQASTLFFRSQVICNYRKLDGMIHTCLLQPWFPQTINLFLEKINVLLN